ncbi:putative metal-binding motif-containing protein [Myxococcota bacterium]|nr:putative metal-binding motif-containing protein [Myxococcota bacterium]
MSWRWILLLCCLTVPMIGGCDQAPPPEKRRPLVDADGDGYPSTDFGGRDCNDEDVGINPLAKEDTTNKRDDNCNGQIDEFTLTTGHWRLTTQDAKQDKSDWHFEIRTNSETGVQYVRCIQFRVRLTSKELNKDTDLSFWLSGLGANEAKIENNRVIWEYKPTGKEESFTLQAQFTSENTVTATMTVTDTTPTIKGTATVNLSGKFEKPDAKNAEDSAFCGRCYGDTTCGAG